MPLPSTPNLSVTLHERLRMFTWQHVKVLPKFHPPSPSPILDSHQISRNKVVSRTTGFLLHKVPGINSTLGKDKWKLEAGESATSNLSCISLTGYSISRIRSLHRNCIEDRIWAFSCESNSAAQHCSWSHTLNSYDGLLDYTCPHDGFISGIYSWHLNGREDRR